MIGHLVACLLGHFSSPVRYITEIQLNHSPAFLTDDMMVMAIRIAKSIFDIGPNRDPKNDSKGLEKIEAPIDRGKPDLPPLLMKGAVEILGA